MYSIMKAILDNPDDKTIVHLLIANKTVDDILMKKELDEAAKDPRFKIYYTVDKVIEYKCCSISRLLLVGRDLRVILLRK